MKQTGSKETSQDGDVLEEPTEVKALSIEEQVEYLAGLQFARDEVAMVTGKEIDGELETAYKRGILLEEAKVREAIKRLAIRGSSPAQKQYMDMATGTKKSNKLRDRRQGK